MNVKKTILGTLGYFVSSFLIQGILTMIIAGEYFKSISIFRENPIMYFALPQTIFTGVAFSVLFSLIKLKGNSIIRGFKYGLLIGLLFIPFMALDLPARFSIPSVWTWVLIHCVFGVLHFSVAGILMSLIYGNEVKGV